MVQIACMAFFPMQSAELLRLSPKSGEASFLGCKSEPGTIPVAVAFDIVDDTAAVGVAITAVVLVVKVVCPVFKPFAVALGASGAPAGVVKVVAAAAATIATAIGFFLRLSCRSGRSD